VNANPPDRRLARVAKIRVRGPGGFEGIVGTGFIVDAGLVLTARHVIKQLVSPAQDADADRRNAEHWRDLDDYPIDMLRACPAEGSTGLPVTALVDLDPALDVVCLVVPGLPALEEPSTTARHVKTVPLENCWMIGYPKAATDDGSVQAEYVGARLIPVSRSADGLLALDITTSRPTQREGWKGASGAGTTDAAGNLLGIVSHVPAQMEGRLLAVGMPEVIAAARTLLSTGEARPPEYHQALEALARLEIAENPAVPNADEGAAAAVAHRLLDAITPILPSSMGFAAQRAHGSISRGRFATGLLVAGLVVMVALASAVVVRWEAAGQPASEPDDSAAAMDTDAGETAATVEEPAVDVEFAIEDLFVDGTCASFDLSSFEALAGVPLSGDDAPSTWDRTSPTTGGLWCEYIVTYDTEPDHEQINLIVEVTVAPNASTADALRQEAEAIESSQDRTVLPLEGTEFTGTVTEFEHFGETGPEGGEVDESEIIRQVAVVASRDNIVVAADMGLEVGVHDIDQGREVLIGLVEQAYLMCGYYVVA
jgi:hypothetical protein